MSAYKLTEKEIENYHRDGYLIIRKFCSPEEIDKLYGTAIEDSSISKNALDLNDLAGKKTKLSLWFHPGNDVFGYLTRSERMINAVSQLLDGDAPVCHFHSKLMQKEPRVGGAWEWHQDYGYWYKNQFMYPDQLISVMVALTKATDPKPIFPVSRDGPSYPVTMPSQTLLIMRLLPPGKRRLTLFRMKPFCTGLPNHSLRSTS